MIAMSRWKQIVAFLSLSIVFLAASAATAQMQLKTLTAQQGGTIVYGSVGGATTQVAAMSKMLHVVHDKCGEKPAVGKVFKFRGTNSVGVFFTVVNRREGNKQVAGMVVAAQTGPHQVEAALVSDAASRFAKTVNPMLQQLSGVWHPGGGAASGTPAGASSGPATGGRSAPPAALRQVTLADRSASIGVPEGWKLDPESWGGTLALDGPHGERAAFNLTREGVDPTNSGLRQLQRRGIRSSTSGKIVYPFNVNLVKAFPDIYQQFRRVNGLGPAELQIAQIEPISGLQGQRCVHATGHVNPDGKGMQELNSVLCTTYPNQYGGYQVVFHITLLPNAVADQERATIGAIIASFQPNQSVIAGQARAISAPTIAAIQQIGRVAAARSAATNAANEAQHAGYWARQDSNARNSKSFSNYQLDQTVIQDNNVYGNGTVGHATVWNATADALIKADPNRYEYVDTPNYWQGADY